MDYVLYSYGAAVLLLVLGAAAIGRHLAASVAEPVGPSYRVGSPSWHAQQAARQGAIRAALVTQDSFVPVLVEWPDSRPPTADEVAAEVAELERQLARVTAPEVEATTIVHWEAPPTFVQADLDHSGAEQWGDLFDRMRTEEQTIYNAQMVLDHDAHMEVERGFLSDLDRIVNRVLAELARANEAAERRAQYWERAAASRADFVDSPTGAWPVFSSV